MRPYRWMVFLSFVAYGLATFVANVFQPLVFRHIIDLVSSSPFRDDRIVVDLWHWFWYYVGILFITQIVLYRIGEFSLAFVESRTMKNLADRTFAELHRHGYRFFADSFSGSLVAKAKRYVANFETLYDTMVFSFWMTSVQVIGMFGTLLVLTPLVSVFFLLFVFGYVWFSWWVMRKKAPYDELSASEDSALTAALSDVLSNILTVKTFSAAQRETESFEGVSYRWAQAKQKSWNFQNIIFFWQTMFLGVLEVVSVGMSLWLWAKGTISPGTVVLVQWYMATTFMSMFQLNRSFGRFVRGLSEASEMVEIFEQSAEVIDPKTPELLTVSKGEIYLNDVTFRYVDNNSPVFDHFSLRIHPGEKVGLVGSSGSGKSTLTKLLLRFADPQSGSVRIDGQDIRSVRQDDLRGALAYVPQEPMLFHRSLRENIAYARPDASEEEIVAAAKRAHAHEFIKALPEGYDTLVGERGVKLSGGERQRVAIARAILKNSKILVLDEATSALDSESEHAIQMAFDELMQGKTAIVIAHRLSTIKKMDRIVVLDKNGRIAEEGSHDELLARAGLYAHLWNRQTGGFIDEDGD